MPHITKDTVDYSQCFAKSMSNICIIEDENSNSDIENKEDSNNNDLNNEFNNSDLKKNENIEFIMQKIEEKKDF